MCKSKISVAYLSYCLHIWEIILKVTLKKKKNKREGKKNSGRSVNGMVYDIPISAGDYIEYS